MIALVHGPDAALARAAVEKLVAANDPAETDTTRFDGRSVTLGEVVAAVATVGFFGGARVVIVSDLMSRASKASGQDADRDDNSVAKSSTGSFDFAALFSSVPHQNLLVLVDPTLSTVPAAVKRAAPADVQIVAAQPPRGAALVNMIVGMAKAADGEIDSATARLLAELLYPQTWNSRPNNPRYDRPPDTERIHQEVEKLVLHAHPRRITADHVRQLVSGVPDDRVFRFIEAATAGELNVAMMELEKLLEIGEEPARLTAQLHQQIELAVVAVSAGRIDPVDVGRALGLSNPNRMLGVSQASHRKNREATFAALDEAVAADRKLKQGHLRWPLDALYLLATMQQERYGTI